MVDREYEEAINRAARLLGEAAARNIQETWNKNYPEWVEKQNAMTREADCGGSEWISAVDEAEKYTKALLADTEAMLARCPPEDFLGRMGFESMVKKLRAEVQEDDLRKKIFYDRVQSRE